MFGDLLAGADVGRVVQRPAADGRDGHRGQVEAEPQRVGGRQFPQHRHGHLLGPPDCVGEPLVFAVLLGFDETAQAAREVGQCASDLGAFTLQGGQVLAQEGRLSQRQLVGEPALQHRVHGRVETLDQFRIKQQPVERVEAASRVGVLDDVDPREDLGQHPAALPVVVDDLFAQRLVQLLQGAGDLGEIPRHLIGQPQHFGQPLLGGRVVQGDVALLLDAGDLLVDAVTLAAQRLDKVGRVGVGVAGQCAEQLGDVGQPGGGDARSRLVDRGDEADGVGGRG